MRGPGVDSARRIAVGRRGPSGRPTRFGTSGDFTGGVGPNIEPDAVRGYYIDLRSKAPAPGWPPDWYTAPPQNYVWITQWGLACHEHHLEVGDEGWLQTALAVGDHLLELQEPEGRLVGGWVHRFPYKHTYHLPPPWLSGMAQGQGASLLVRLHRATGDERYAEAAIRALEPMRHSTLDGGVAGDLGGGFFPQEYPTSPAAHVLNGGIFALWGCYDAAVALGDDLGRQLATEGIATLAESLPRWDTGYWSRYDLFPHPLAHVATPMYHRLHTDQLRAMALIDSNPEFSEAAERFDGYARSRVNVGHAFARKVLFRLAVPRNRWLAFRMPWTRPSSR